MAEFGAERALSRTVANNTNAGGFKKKTQREPRAEDTTKSTLYHNQPWWPSLPSPSPETTSTRDPALVAIVCVCVCHAPAH